MAREGLTASGKALEVLSTFGRDHAQQTLSQIAHSTRSPDRGLVRPDDLR